MPAEAPIAPIWRKQKLFVSLFLIAFGGWFFLDGWRTYPRSNERWTAFEQLKNEGRLAEWPALADSRGWVHEQPHKFYTPAMIREQYALGSLVSLAGAIFLAYWATQIRRVLRSDEEAVYTPAGTRVPFEAITGIGKKRWESKGIATVRYQLNGRQGQFLVDDYKFETAPARQILAEIEEKLLARQGGKA